MSVCVVTDSTADIPSETLDELGISVVPLKVIFGDEEFIDGVTMQAPEFYERLVDDNVFPTTSQPSPGEFMDMYTKLLEQHDGIVSIHISAELSGPPRPWPRTCSSGNRIPPRTSRARRIVARP